MAAAAGIGSDPIAHLGIAPSVQAALTSPRSPQGRPAPAGAALTPAVPRVEGSNAIQQSITRIHEACQAPPMSPHEYRVLFEVMAKEITENDLIGAQTLANIAQRAQERGLNLSRDDVRFVLEVVSEADPWFEQGASANLFAGRFRNFVVARCRGQGLNLSADELDLIDAWFAGGQMPQAVGQPPPSARPDGTPIPATAAGKPIGQTPPLPKTAPDLSPPGSRWWTRDDNRAKDNEWPASDKGEKEDFPRFVRSLGR
jgi:hypothetical protein